MIKKRVVLFLVLICCLAAGFGHAQTSNVVGQSYAKAATSGTNDSSSTERVAQLGDRSLALHVSEWIKGRPVKLRPGTNVYVVIFCSLSRANEFALTNLNALQKEYRDKGVVVVAVSAEATQQLKDYVEANGGNIDFTVGADEIPGRTANNYLHAFRQMQLPRAFIVGTNNTVLWQGHPLTDGMGAVVDDIVSGRYSLEQTKKSVLDREVIEQYLIFARMGDARSRLAGKRVLANRRNDAPALVDFAFKIATDAEIDQTNRDVELANTALNRAERLSTTNTTDVDVTRAMLLFQTGQEEAGLLHATDSLQFAKTQAEKDELQACINLMQTRIAFAKTNQVSAPGTNQVNAPSVTNQTGSLVDKH